MSIHEFGDDMESFKVLKNMHRRIIRNFLDVLILAELRNGPMSGYDFIAYIHDKFHFLMSSGTVYSLLYSLERQELITGVWNQRRRVYRLTEKGEQTIKAIVNDNNKMGHCMSRLLEIH